MIHALSVQGAVHDQVRVVGLKVALQGTRVLLYHFGTQHHIGADHGCLCILKCQNIGGIVCQSIGQVQLPSFLTINTAHRQLCRTDQGRLNPPGHPVARQQRPVSGVSHL